MEAILMLIWLLIILNFLILLYEFRNTLYSKFVKPVKEHSRDRQIIEFTILVLLFVLALVFSRKYNSSLMTSFNQFIELITINLELIVDIATVIAVLLAAVQIKLNNKMLFEIKKQTEAMTESLRLNIVKTTAEKINELGQKFYILFFEKGLNELLSLPSCNKNLWNNKNKITKYKIYVSNIIQATTYLRLIITLLRNTQHIPQQLIQKLEDIISEILEESEKLLEKLLILEIKYNYETCTEAINNRQNLFQIKTKINKIIKEIEKYEPLLVTDLRKLF